MSYVAVFISGVAIFATFLFLTYYLQVIKRESPLATGLLFLPMIGCILISSNLSSIVGLARVGPRVLIAAGMLLGAGGMAYLAQVTVTSGYASAVLPALLILGLGFGMIFAPAINTATSGVARRDSGVASALVNTMQQVGGSIGTSALSTIALSATASYLISPPHQPAGTGDCRHPRLHRRLQRLSSAARTRLHPRDRPAAVEASADRAQERRRKACRSWRRPGRGPIACRPRPAARVRGDSGGPVQLLAGSDRSSRPGGHAGPPQLTTS